MADLNFLDDVSLEAEFLLDVPTVRAVPRSLDFSLACG